VVQDAVNETITQAPVYSDFTLPEGMQIDKGALDAFKPIASELGLTQESAQKIVNIGVMMAESGTKQQETGRQEAIEKARGQWVKQITDDPDFGGEGLQENLATANSFLKKTGRPGFVNLLTQAGLGDHPEVILQIWEWAKMNGDDSVVIGGNAGQPSGLGKMYENSPGLK
jgi:hypothetical protein